MIGTAFPTLRHSSDLSNLHNITSFVTHYTLNIHYFFLLSHYAHFTFTFYLQHIHCSCFCCRVHFFSFYLLSQLIYFFCLTQTQRLSHFYASLIFQLRILSNFQTTLIPLSLYTHATLTLCLSHFHLTLTSHTHTTFVLLSHYTHFTFTLQSLYSHTLPLSLSLYFLTKPISLLQLTLGL